MLNAARTGVVEERMGRAFSRKEHLELNREGEEVSQVKKGDHKEVKRKQWRTRLEKQSGPSYATLGNQGFIPSTTVLNFRPGNQMVRFALQILYSGDTEEIDGKKKERGRAK